MIVDVGGDFLYQRITVVALQTAIEYKRAYYNNSWSAWISSSTEEKLLWSGSATSGTITLAEPFTNFHDLVFMFNSGSNIVWHVVSGTDYIRLGNVFPNTTGRITIISSVSFEGIVNNTTLPMLSNSAFTINNETGTLAVSQPIAIARIYGIRRRG